MTTSQTTKKTKAKSKKAKSKKVAKVKILQKNPTTKTTSMYGVKVSGVQIVASKTCPRCNKTSKGVPAIMTQFGYRNMKNSKGEITSRPQTYCRDC